MDRIVERLDWHANWIWGGNESSPRNEWRCFRKSFQPLEEVGQAKLRISADSRYVLYVNGKQAGRGPVRSWTTSWSYDEYEIGHLLEPGKENVIAVLVLHYGISTFQYVRARGGLLLQLDYPNGDVEDGGVTTDHSWKTAVHQGYDTNSSRISCQMGFTEIVDARLWDERWVSAGYDDSAWEAATVIGEAGVEPWGALVPRDIPFLTEEPIYPSRVESISAVLAPKWGVVIDLYALMSPDSGDHSNNIQFCGYLAAELQLETSSDIIIGLPDGGRIKPELWIDGKFCIPDELPAQVTLERQWTLRLEAGSHILLLDVSGMSHGHGFHIGIDCASPFSLQPIKTDDAGAEQGESEFTLIGPFDALTIIDYRPSRELNRAHPDYLAIREAASAAELIEFVSWFKVIEPVYINRNDVFAAHVWQIENKPQPMPQSATFAVTAGLDAALLPVFPDRDTELVIDMGRELSGYITFELDASEGTIIDLYGLEYIRDGWRQHTYSLDNTLRYRCREGRQSYQSVIRRGLRYLTLTVRGADRPVRLYSVQMIQSNYPVANVGQFLSSDTKLNEIWRISRETTRLCMEDTFVDCPAYEQAYWVGDARNEALVNYYTFGAKEIVERCLKLVPGSGDNTPFYMDQLPSGWNSVIPNWTFFWVTACLEYYEYAGDKKFLNDIWPHVERTMHAYWQERNEQGLFEFNGWNLLDWAPFEQPATGIVTPQNMFLVRALTHAAEIARIVGESAKAMSLNECAQALRQSINQYLWDDERSAYVDCIRSDGSYSETLSVQTHIVACLCDIAQGSRKETAESYLVDAPQSFVKVGSPFMSFFHYEALAKMGRYDLLMQDLQRNYGVMVDNGASACWEMYPWSGFFSDPKLLTRSHCHAWSAGPAYFLGVYVLGIQGLTPGWSEVKFAPQPCGLRFASGSVPLPSGERIDVSWREEGDGQLQAIISAPSAVKISVEAPAGYEMTVVYRCIGKELP
ncbi:family 78 glycoside hydrolase catalytic domain [Paenibacillus sp. strain BS8-2]